MFWVKAGRTESSTLPWPPFGRLHLSVRNFSPWLPRCCAGLGLPWLQSLGTLGQGPVLICSLEPTPCQAHGPRVKNQVFLGSNPSLVI